MLRFEQNGQLTKLNITVPDATAEIYLQGAHFTAWQPAGQGPAIFLSRKSEFAPGKPIRGGIPVAFPWFAADSNKTRVDGRPGPSHGFARLQDWTLTAAKPEHGGFRVQLQLGPTEMSRHMGYGDFLLTLDALIAQTLEIALTVRNTGDKPLSYEEAFHSYFHVMDIHETQVTGLEPTGYIDKIDGFKPKPAAGAPVTFTGPVDRVYQDTTAPCTIHDRAQKRAIRIVKSGSHTTVVWNPGKELPDIGEWEWHEMVCVETVNAGTNALMLAPGESRRMAATISLETLKR